MNEPAGVRVTQAKKETGREGQAAVSKGKQQMPLFLIGFPFLKITSKV